MALAGMYCNDNEGNIPLFKPVSKRPQWAPHTHIHFIRHILYRGTQRARLVYIHFTRHILGVHSEQEWFIFISPGTSYTLYRGAQQARMVHIHFTRHILYRVNQRARMVPHSNKKLFIKRCFNFKNIRIFAG